MSNDLLEALDHINMTKDLVNALMMAAEIVGLPDSAALTTLSSVIIDRLEEVKGMMEALGADAGEITP